MDAPMQIPHKDVISKEQETLKTVPNNSSIAYFIIYFLKNTTFDNVKAIKKGLQTWHATPFSNIDLNYSLINLVFMSAILTK